jgi:hypothetical protein
MFAGITTETGGAYNDEWPNSALQPTPRRDLEIGAFLKTGCGKSMFSSNIGALGEVRTQRWTR